MDTSSITSTSTLHQVTEDASHGLEQSRNASDKAKGKGVASTSKQPVLPQDNRYLSSPLASTSEHARVSKLTRGHATPNNESLQRTPERGTASAQRTPPRIPGRSEPSLQRLNASRANPVLMKITEDMKASNKVNRANSIPDTPEKVPLRLREKVKSVNLSKLKKLDNRLHNLAKIAVMAIENGRGPNAEFNYLDIELLPMFAQAENSRHSDLNLQVFKKAPECYGAIREANENVQRSKEPASMRAIYPPLRGMPNHYIALDVQLRPGHRPSIIAFESAAGYIVNMLESSFENDFRDARSKVVFLNTQDSDWDCVMFAMSNALKAHKHQNGYMSELHKGKTALIPADFLKHSHSSQRVEHAPNKDDFVTKDKAGPHKETLEHRNYAYRAQRGYYAYSASIEGFRLQEITRAGEYLKNQSANDHKIGLFSFLRGKISGAN